MSNATAEKTVELGFFNAKQFMLTAVDTSLTFPVEYSEPGNSIAFCLDGVIYAAVEDPNDGYRSSLDRVLVLPSDTKLSTPLVVPARLFARHISDNSTDVVEFIDMGTGKVAMAIGTRDADDYYPWFVADWDPTALSSNQTES